MGQSVAKRPRTVKKKAWRRREKMTMKNTRAKHREKKF